MLAMLDIHAHPGPGRAIRTEFVGDHHARRAGWLADKLAQELLRRVPTLAALNQGAGNEAVRIDSANMALRLAVDRDHDLAEMLLVAELRRAPPDLVGVGSSERLRPAPHSFVTDDASARRQQVLDHPQADRKTDREPDGVFNNVRREPVAAINGCQCRDHRARKADVHRHFVNLTAPA